MAKKSEKKKAKKEKFDNKLNTMDKILIVLAVLTVVFTIVMMVFFYIYQSIPDTLCTCFFAAVVGECGGMSWIKCNKERYKEREYQLEDRAYDEKVIGSNDEE